MNNKFLKKYRILIVAVLAFGLGFCFEEARILIFVGSVMIPLFLADIEANSTDKD